MDDLPRSFVIRESSHRIHNPFTSEKLATLGHALGSITANPVVALNRAKARRLMQTVGKAECSLLLPSSFGC